MFKIRDKAGQAVQIHFEAAWPAERHTAPHLVDFQRHLLEVVPRIVSGLSGE